MNMNGELWRRGQSSCDATKDPIWGNVLAVQSILRRRGIGFETYCPLCEDEEETQVHLFFRCPFARCWKGLCNKYGGEKEFDQLLQWVVFFEKVVCEPRVALDLLHQQWREIKDSRWDNEQHHCRQQVVEGETHRRWVKPPFCTIKFDGGSESNEIGTNGLCGKGIRVCLVGDGFEGLGGDAKWSLGSGGSNGGYPMGYSPYSTTIELC
ncbi:ribonuclease H protein [Pyrus ussuriensis x Pyrus communis]|uniref:Ribonuclease H protein n=1 Tax=Pyrus ussuriensis x Pyrus communis TaxID=2448454 RepID=A0A5N5FJD9_9ROSA|nr:ribonuclease H protein [Pyrus ussuriensis x Pyrus communis]